MKTSSRKLVIGVVFIVIAAGIAYWMGLSSGTVPAKSVTIPSEKPISKAAPNTPPVAVAPKIEMPKNPPAVVPSPTSEPVAKSTDHDKLVKYFLDLLDQTLKSPPGSHRNAQIRAQILALSAPDPVLALSKVELIDDLKARNEIIGGIYGTWLIEDPQQGLAAMAQLPAGKQTQAYYLQAFQAWAEANPNNPPLAAAAALSLPPGSDQVQALNGVATSWANYDPQAVLNWASGLQPANAAAMYSAVVEASAQKPNLAAQYVNQLTDASAQSKAIQNISVNMTKTDPAATLAWLDQVATGETYDNSVAKLISTVVVKNPTLASALMAQVTEPGVSDAVSASLASSNWARTFPRDAAAWLKTLPESPARDAAIQKLVPSTSGN